ncbi:MAG: SUF system Fe-S cluster assembly protein [Bacteroidales bacterium]
MKNDDNQVAKDYMAMEVKILDQLKQVFDPEIPINIYDLGLIYEVDVDDDNNVNIRMTLTAPNCPVADSLPMEVKERVQGIAGVNNVNLELVFDPPWGPTMMSEEAKLELGFL